MFDGRVIAHVRAVEPLSGRTTDTDSRGSHRLLRDVSRVTGWNAVLKAIEDKVLGLLLAAIALPVMLLIALAIRLESSGPAIFRQRRHGQNGCEFEILKFRTMVWEPQASFHQTTRNDPRVTRVGWFLRRTSLDELPQLLNVVRGDMSLVGPRPHAVEMRTEGKLCSEIAVEYWQRYRFRPGITGLAQINGCRGATESCEQLRKRLEYDLAYIENWSLLLDLRILITTPWRLLFDRGQAF